MFKASILALVLQCGTTAAAEVIIVFTPTVGFGCRALGYAIYGGLAILILFFTSDVGFLWYNVIGCGIVVILSIVIEGLRPAAAPRS